MEANIVIWGAMIIAIAYVIVHWNDKKKGEK